MRAVTVAALAVCVGGASYAGLILPAHSQTRDSTRCETIADKQQRIACFEQAGVPVVDCHQPRNADDAAFCREVLSRDRDAPPPSAQTPVARSPAPVAQPPVRAANAALNAAPVADKTKMPTIAAVVGSSPETRQLICTTPEAIAYLKNNLRNTNGPDLELRDVAAVDSRTCRATIVENGKGRPG